MTDKKNIEKKSETKSETLSEQELDQAQGGFLSSGHTTGSNFSFGVEREIKPRLTDAELTSARMNLTTDGTKIRK